MRLFMQRLTLLFLLVTVIIAMVTMGLSWRADNASSELNKLEKQIEEVKVLIRVLEGEWSQLNRPERLKELAEQYLDIQKLSAYNQIEDVKQLPTRSELEAAKVREQQEKIEQERQAIATVEEDIAEDNNEVKTLERRRDENIIEKTIEEQDIEPYMPIESIISDIEVIEEDPIKELIEKE